MMNSLPCNAEKPRQFRVGFQAERRFDNCLVHVHANQSRTLDDWPSSTLDICAHRVTRMTTMAERIKELLAYRGREPMDLVQATGLSKGAVYFILDGTTKPEKVWASTLVAIADYLGSTVPYLLHGKGLRLAEAPDQRVAELVANYMASSEQGRRALEMNALALAQPAPGIKKTG